MDSFETKKQVMNQAHGTLKLIEVSKQNAMKALDAFIRLNLRRGKLGPTKLYTEVWNQLSDEVYLNSNSANATISKEQNTSVDNL